MVCGDAAGVLVSPAPASVLNLATAAVTGRLLEPDLIALSSHGGHHLFINRIPPRLPKEDVEKIILSQLRLHPFVLQVSKCSVIPQNSLKNKGYGFITLDGSPSPSDLDAIADSLNNKLQVGCRTLGVRVCTDCHSACYAEEDGCASSSSSTPPNEPADDELPLPQEQPSAAGTETNADHPQTAAAAGDAMLALAPDHSPSRASSAPAPQLELLQTAVAVLAKQASLPAGLASGPAPGARRRKTAKQQQQHDQKPSSEPLPPQQQQQSRGHHYQQPLGQALQQLRPSCRLGKPQGGHGSAQAAAGRQRRHTGDASPGLAASADPEPGSMSALLSPLEGFTADRSLGPAGPSDMAQPPPPLPPAMSAPLPQPHAPAVAQQQPRREHLPSPPLPPSHDHQAEVPQDGGECGGSAAVSGSPRSVSSYSSAPGSGPGSASNSAPGSVCSGHGSGSGSATGSGRVSGSSASGWGSREDCVDAKASPLGASAAASMSAGKGGAPAGVGPQIPDALDSVALLSNSGSRQVSHAVQQHHHHSNNQPQRNGSDGRGASDCATATSPPRLLLAGQQSAAPGPARQPQLPAQSFGSTTRCPRAIGTCRSRGAFTAAPVAPGPHGRAGRGQVTAAQRVPASPPSTSQQSVCAWNAGPSASGLGPTGPSDHLHSASAPPSSSWYIHQVFQRHEHDPRVHAQQRQQQHPPAQGAYLHVRIDSGGSGHEGRSGGSVAGVGDGGKGAGGVGSAGGGAGVVGGPAASGRGFGRLRGVQPPPQQAVSDAVYGGHMHGPPRSAWLDGSGDGGAGGLGTSVGRRGSHPGGPLKGTQGGLPAHLAMPHYQQQQHRQVLPSHQHQHQWLSYSLDGPTNPGPQAQQQMALPAHQPNLQQRQQSQQALQQPSLGAHFAPQVQPPGLRLSQPHPPTQHSGQASHQQQQLLQRQQCSDGPPPAQRPSAQAHNYQQHKHPQWPGGEPQQWQQHQVRHQQQKQKQPLSDAQQQAQQQQQQQQALHAFIAHGGGAHPAAPLPADSGCLLSASPTPPPTARPVQLLLGGAGPVAADALRGGSPAPLASSLPPSLVGWRPLDLEYDCLLDLEYDIVRRTTRPEAVELPLLAAGAQAGSLLPLAATAAASGVSAPSAEFAFLGRGSSDGFQDVGACSAGDSADLDPLDLEPMILQLLENDDDDRGIRSAVPTAGRRDCVDPHIERPGPLAQGGPLPLHVLLQHEQRLSGAGGCLQHPLPSSVPPTPLVPPAAALQGGTGGPSSSGSHYHQRQHPQLHPHQPQQQRHQQQPQRQQAGFETGSTVAGMGSAPCAEVAATWAAPRPCSNGSNNSSGGSTVGTFGTAAAGAHATAASHVPASAAATPRLSSLGGHSALALHPASAGGVVSVPERARAPAAAAGARWARAQAECGPGSGLSLVGSFPGPGAGPGSYEGTAGSWHRRGGAGNGSRVAGGGGGSGGGGHGGVGAGHRGARQHGGGARGTLGPVGHGGGRVSGSREGAMGRVGGAGMAMGVRMGAMAGHPHVSGGGGAGGGCEPQGFVSGSLPNANLLAVMQRLNA